MTGVAFSGAISGSSRRVETEYLQRKAILPLDDPLASRNGGPGAFPTVANAGGGLGEALEKGFGQAKLFFNIGVVLGRAS